MIVIPRRAVLWPILVTLGIATGSMIAARPAVAQSNTATDPRPTVAVMQFTNASLVEHARYGPLAYGIADQLVTTLRDNPGIRLIERHELQRLLDEQALTRSGQIDPATALQIGRILGAHHMIFGGFLIEPSGRMRMTARAVNVNTSEVEHTTSARGDMDDIIDTIDDLARKLNTGLHLPDMPGRRQRPGGTPPRSNRWFMLYSQALVEEAARRNDAAASLYKQTLAEYPDYEPARLNLARLQGGG